MKCKNITLSKFILLFYGIIFSHVVFSNTSTVGVYNSNPLILHAVDPDIINLVVNPFNQNVAFTMAVEHRLTQNNTSQRINYIIDYDPFNYSKSDLKFKVLNDELTNTRNNGIGEIIDEVVENRIYLKGHDLYLAKSIKEQSSTGSNSTFTFKLNLKVLPRGLSHLALMNGTVKITAEGLEITLKNEAPYKNNGVYVTHFEKTLYFTRLSATSGYLIKNTTSRVSGTKDDEPYLLELSSKPLIYRNKKFEPFYLTPAMKAQGEQYINAEKQYTTLYVDDGNFFPLLGEATKAEGYMLPKTYGISTVIMHQTTHMKMTSFDLNNTDINHLVGGDDASVVSNTNLILLRGDMWVLPFLNVSVLAGNAYSSNDVNFTLCPDKCTIGQPPIEIEIGPMPVEGSGDTKSLIYGVGATIAGGIGDFFSTVDFQYITSYTDSADAELSMTVILPMIGYNFTQHHTQVFIGGQYQDQKEQIIASADDNIVKVGLKTEKWSALIGANYDISRSWSSSLLYSKGEDITNLSLAISYRF